MQSEVPTSFTSQQHWADWIRAIGILLVILGHVSAVVVTRWQDVTPSNWMTGNIYNVIARSCVPLLFMVSGALLLPRQESIWDFYQKRLQRMLFPFLIWSVFYIFTKESFAGYTFSTRSRQSQRSLSHDPQNITCGSCMSCLESIFSRPSFGSLLIKCAMSICGISWRSGSCLVPSNVQWSLNSNLK